MDSAPITVATSGPVTRIELARPARRNALGLEVMEALIAELRTVDGRVVILGAQGPVFSAGHDLAELHDGDVAEHTRTFQACVELMETVQSVPQPVIAEVQGLATAAGCQLVAACDLAVASEEARFATPGVRIGLFCSTPMVPLSRAVGPKRAMQMLLTGDPIEAVTAADWGLVNQVVPVDELRATTEALATRIAESSPSTIAFGKRTFHRQLDLDQRLAYDLAAAAMVANASAPSAREGIAAFLDKREPRWPDVP